MPSVGADQHRATEEIRALREVVAVYSQLSGLATQDTDIGSVITFIAERLGVVAVVLDVDHDVLAAAGSAPEAVEGVRTQLNQLDVANVLATSARTKRAMTLSDPSGDGTLVIAPILLGDEIPAFLVIGSPDADNSDEDTALLVTEHAAMVCGIILGRQQVVASAAGHARLDLVEGLLLARNRTDFELYNWARHLGIEPQSQHLVLTVDLEPTEPGAESPRAEAAALAERFIQSRTTDAVVVRREGEVVAIVPVTSRAESAIASVMTTAARCRAAVEARFPGCRVCIGVGGVCDGASEIARSYDEARRAVETTARMTGLGGVIAFGDLGIHRLLLRVSDVADLRTFAHEVLGGLLSHERDHGTDYLTTLSVYFSENNSPKQTARRLHMHPNTVTYRIRRVEEITGLRINAYRDRLMIQVALEIINGLEDSR